MSYQVGLTTVISDGRELVNITKAEVSGIVTARFFYGDGTNLTGLGVSNLNSTNNNYQIVRPTFVGSVGIATIDCNLGHNVDIYISAGSTITYNRINIDTINIPQVLDLRVKINNAGGSFNIYWNTPVDRSGGITTQAFFYTGNELEWFTMSPNWKWVEYSLTTVNNGRNWYGSILGRGGYDFDMIQPPYTTDFWYDINPYQMPTSVSRYTTGALYSIGSNLYGQLGQNTTIDRSSYGLVGVTTSWAKVNAGTYHCAGIRTDGTVWTWGYNGYGQLGVAANTIPRSSPSQVGSATDYIDVVCGGNHTLFLKGDGRIDSIGYNVGGQLGVNDATPRSTMQTVSFPSKFPRVRQIFAGENHSALLTYDGGLYTWGSNGSGQLGDNTATDKYTPIRASTHSFWSRLPENSGTNSLNSTYCIQTDGSLWAWGANAQGQLGDGTVIPRSSAVRLSINATYKRIYPSYTACFGQRVDDTLDFWGYNATGLSGDGTATNKSTPVRVMSDKRWRKISSQNHTIGIATDGTLWDIGGYNLNGQMPLIAVGLNLSSPIVISSDTNWHDVTSGWYCNLVLKRQY